MRVAETDAERGAAGDLRSAERRGRRPVPGAGAERERRVNGSVLSIHLDVRTLAELAADRLARVRQAGLG
jgi:hypothetical protein